ncbi:MAG: HAD hydrolase-like protein [Pseudonocardiales bacterium]|nr:HAD hydrolase-like protein [Actinomycetota bacterium]
MPVTPVVMFDLDGTLSDSAPGILGSLRHAFEVNGLPQLDSHTQRALLGPPFYESLPPLIGHAALPDVIAAYREHYGRVGMYETSVYPGIVELLAGLRAAGVRLAVATSKPEDYAVPIIAYLGLAEFFETVGGDELDGSLRTKALVIGRVLGRLGQPGPADVVMVGDRSHDVNGARAHGIAAFAVSWGYAVPGELVAARPLAICASPAELGHALAAGGVDAAAS